jgi:DNA-binding transcriptional MerR regulator
MNGTVVVQKHSLQLVCPTETGPATYSLETAASLAGIHPEMLRYYCRFGLFGDVGATPDAELIFDDDAIYQLRRFEHYRRNNRVSRKTLRLIFSLWRDIELLQTELRYLRES